MAALVGGPVPTLSGILVAGPVRRTLFSYLTRREIAAIGQEYRVVWQPVDYSYSYDQCGDVAPPARPTYQIAPTQWTAINPAPDPGWPRCTNGRGYMGQIEERSECHVYHGANQAPTLVCDACHTRNVQEWEELHEPFYFGVCKKCRDQQRRLHAQPFDGCRCYRRDRRSDIMGRTCRPCIASDARAADVISAGEVAKRRLAKWHPPRKRAPKKKPATVRLKKFVLLGQQPAHPAPPVPPAPNPIPATWKPNCVAGTFGRAGGTPACGRPAWHSRRGPGNEVRTCVNCLGWIRR